MKIAIKTFLNTSGLNRLSQIMMHEKTGYVIPKESWVFERGRYIKKIYIDKKCIPKGFRLWNGESIDKVYSFETSMIDNRWIYDLKSKGIIVSDIPMIEWVERKKFEQNKYSIFDEIICLNDYCYNIFKERYKSAKRVCFELNNEQKNINIKENVIYHQASCSSFNPFKNTDAVIEAFLNLKSNFRLIITGVLNDSQIKKINGTSIQYKGVLNYEDILEIFSYSKFYLAPSLQEGLSIPLYEAKRYRCKIITTDFSPMKEVGDYLCETKITNNFGKFMYPKLSVSKKAVYNALYKAINDNL